VRIAPLDIAGRATEVQGDPAEIRITAVYHEQRHRLAGRTLTLRVPFQAFATILSHVYCKAVPKLSRHAILTGAAARGPQLRAEAGALGSHASRGHSRCGSGCAGVSCEAHATRPT
jgi:hypothetical protein